MQTIPFMKLDQDLNFHYSEMNMLETSEILCYREQMRGAISYFFWKDRFLSPVVRIAILSWHYIQSEKIGYEFESNVSASVRTFKQSYKSLDVNVYKMFDLFLVERCFIMLLQRII